MITYYYFSKKDDKEGNNDVRTKGYINEFEGKTTYENLQKIGDKFSLNAENFILHLDKEQKQRFIEYNFNSGKYIVTSINEPTTAQEFRSVFLKEE